MHGGPPSLDNPTGPRFGARRLEQGHQASRLVLELGAGGVAQRQADETRGDGDERSKKVRISHSSAIVKGIAEGTIEWEIDPDFGYQVAKNIPGIAEEDADILQPRRLYEQQGRMDEYNQTVARLKNERREYLQKWDGLKPEIAHAVE